MLDLFGVHILVNCEKRLTGGKMLILFRFCVASLLKITNTHDFDDCKNHYRG